MKHTTTWMKWIGAGAIVLTGVAGCGNDKNGNGSVADEGAAAVGNEANAVSNGVSNAAPIANNAATALGNVASSAVGKLNTPQIKTDIAANPAGHSIKNLNVDTSGKTITLSGSGSAAAKAVAGKIAMKDAPGYTIKNNISMGGGKMSGGKMSGKKM